MFLQKLTEFFSTWEVQLSVLLSMLIQIFLFFFGSQRKISKAIWLKVLIWCAYMSADAVAIFSLGVLAQNGGELYREEPLRNHQLQLLWVPFLILHLGGPDTITAYSLEDNNLWLRHLLNLVIQIGVAFYAVVKSWNNHTHTPLTYLVIPIFVWAVVRYCERIWALKSATLERIHDRLSSEWKHRFPDPTGTIFDELNKAYQLLSTLTYHFAHKLLPRENDFHVHGRAIIDMTPLNAFKLVEDELGLMYDLLYTKVLWIHSRWGICQRGVYLVSSIATLTSFIIMHKLNEAKWSNYPLSDVLITYFFMIGAVILEIYAVIWVVSSDWTLVWLGRCQRLKTPAKSLFQIICTCRRVLFSEKRWSRSLKQHNMVIRTCTLLAKHRDVFPVSSLPSGWKNSELFDTFSVEVEGDDADFMKELVFQAMLDWWRGRYYFLQNNGFFEFMKSTCGFPDYITKDLIQFDTSIFAWHVATALCYYSDKEQLDDVPNANVRPHYKASRYLSDYLMYLVRFREDMLPPGNYKQTYAPLVKFMGRFFDGFDSKSFVDACEKIIIEADLESDRGRSPEEIGAIQMVTEPLLKYLTHCLKIRYNPSLEERWKTISSAWAHLLVCSAA